MAMRRMLPRSFEEERRSLRGRLAWSGLTMRRSIPRGEAGGKALARKAVAGREDHPGYIEVEAEVEERRDHLTARIEGVACTVGQAGHALEEDVPGHQLRGGFPGGVERVLDHEEILGRVRARSPHRPGGQRTAVELGPGIARVVPLIDAARVAERGHVDHRLARRALRSTVLDLERGRGGELALHLLDDGGAGALDESLSGRDVEAGSRRLEHAREGEGNDREDAHHEESLDQREALLIAPGVEWRHCLHFLTSTVDRITGRVWTSVLLLPGSFMRTITVTSFASTAPGLRGGGHAPSFQAMAKLVGHTPVMMVRRRNPGTASASLRLLICTPSAAVSSRGSGRVGEPKPAARTCSSRCSAMDRAARSSPPPWTMAWPLPNIMAMPTPAIATMAAPIRTSMNEKPAALESRRPMTFMGLGVRAAGSGLTNFGDILGIP